MDNFWFKRKKYGYGWQPSSREGWFVTIVFIAVVVFTATKFSETNPPKFLAALLISTALFIFIAYKTGEKPKWSWGK